MWSSLETGAGLDVILWLQSHIPHVVDYLLAPFHFLGSEYGYILVFPLIYWCLSKEVGKKFLFLLLFTALTNTVFKLGWRRPRPFVVAPDRVTPFFTEEGFGLPSGHTMFGTVVGGWAFMRFRGLWPRVASVAFILLMGFSRMVHGVHFPQDVVIGLLLGLAVLALYAWVEPLALRFAELADRRWHYLVALGLGILAIVLALVFGHDFEERKSILAAGGALVGGLLGLVWESRYIRFSSGGDTGLRIVRGVAGIATLLIVYFGLTGLFYALVGEHAGLPVLIAYLARYALVGIWITFGAPALFLRFGLADPD